MYKDNTQLPEVQRYLNSEIQRYDVINYLIEKYNLVNYLEIGVFKGENIQKIKAQHKDGVDPGHEGYLASEVNYQMTSDEFFENIKGQDIKYDIIFIDGLHHAEQVEKDIKNSLNHVVEGGFIILHDCNPLNYEMQLVPRETIVWNGDVWKAFVDFKLYHPNIKCCVIDTDFGVGVIQNIPNKVTIVPHNFWNWDYFEKNRKQLLNLISWDEFKRTY